MNSTSTDLLWLAKANLKRALRLILIPTAFSLSIPLYVAGASPAYTVAQSPRGTPAEEPIPRQTARSPKKVKKLPHRVPESRALIAPARVNSLLYGTMERVETLSSIYENLGLRVSTGTLKKILALNNAVNSASAIYFTPEQKPARENSKTYSGLLESALRSLRILKDLKDRMKPEDTEKALLAARDLYQTIGTDLAGPGLIPVPPEAAARPAATAQNSTASAHPTGGEDLANETETLVTISEVTFALSAWRKDAGRFPGKLKDLAPKYIPSIPAIAIAGHPVTNATVEIDSADYDTDIQNAMKDTGAWVYFSNKKSRYYGRVFVDCTHKNSQGVEFYKIGAGQ